MKTIIIDGIEYNLTPKVLFKKGDFVVIQETTYLISKIEGLNVTLSCNGRDCLFDIDVLKNTRLWDITKDAKDGDVLYSPSHHLIWIYKDNEHYHASINLNYANVVSFDNEIVVPSDVCPANRVQRSILFQKMEESNYKWDADKKELKKIEQKLASSAKTCKNDTLLDLLHKMPSCITVDGICYHFMLRKTIIYYTAFYEGEGEEGKGKTIFLITGDLVDILNEILRKLKEGGLLE